MSKFRELFLESLIESNIASLFLEDTSAFKSTTNIADVANKLVKILNGENFSNALKNNIKPTMETVSTAKEDSNGGHAFGNAQLLVSYYITTKTSYLKPIREGYPSIKVSMETISRVSDHDKKQYDASVDVYIPNHKLFDKTVNREKDNIKKYAFDQATLKIEYVKAGYKDIISHIKKQTEFMDNNLDILKDPKVFNVLLNNPSKFLTEYDFPNTIWKSDWFLSWIEQCRKVRNSPINAYNTISR